ncbi:MAG: hypothetical protein ACI9A7_001637 [Cyclobacteriaceae bacterium]
MTQVYNKTPQVVALDAWFRTKKDALGDIELKRALELAGNRLITIFNYSSQERGDITKHTKSHPYFESDERIMYSSFILDENKVISMDHTALKLTGQA